MEIFTGEEAFDLHLHVEVEYSLLGHVLDMGQVKRIIKNIFPTDDLALLKQGIAAPPELEKVDICLQYDSLIEKYYRSTLALINRCKAMQTTITTHEMR